MTTVVDGPGPDSDLIGRCYTKARREPLVHGVIRDVNGGRGIRLPGGPYTLTQLATIVGTLVVLILTRPVWGGHGIVDAALLLGLPFAASFLLQQLHIDGRNPAAALLSVMAMLSEPKRGRLHGRPFRHARPARSGARIILTAPTGGRPAPSAAAVPPAPATPPPTAAAPAPAAVGVPVASGAQALLARRAASTRKEART